MFPPFSLFLFDFASIHTNLFPLFSLLLLHTHTHSFSTTPNPFLSFSKNAQDLHSFDVPCHLVGDSSTHWKACKEVSWNWNLVRPSNNIYSRRYIIQLVKSNIMYLCIGLSLRRKVASMVPVVPRKTANQWLSPWTPSNTATWTKSPSTAEKSSCLKVYKNTFILLLSLTTEHHYK